MDEIESLQATRVAHHLMISALIQTHPQYEAFQLRLTAILEKQLAPGSSLHQVLNAAQREAVRETVEWTQGIQESPVVPPWRPPAR